MTDTKPTGITAVLQRPFPPNEIGKLPRGGAMLDYVGHADVTRRLLEADPEWNWEPLATDDHGLPVFDCGQNGQPVGLWIRLTVGGFTRLGYGSVPANQNDAVKVLIGDALRNAAMRFGVALDLWAKGDRADPTAENATAPGGPRVQAARSPRRPKRAEVKAPDGAETDLEWMGHMVDSLIPAATTRDELNSFWAAVDKHVLAGECTDEHAVQVKAIVKERARELGLDKAAA